MTRDDDFVEERTNVPTYQEVSEVLGNKSFKKNHFKKQNFSNEISSKPKKSWLKFIFIIFSVILLLSALGSAGYYGYKYRGTLTGNVINNVAPAISGFFITEINYSDVSRYGYEIHPKNIDILAEEENLEDSLSDTCVMQKKDLENKVRREEETECAGEKEEIENDLQDEIDYWEEKYQDCNDELDGCSG